MEIGQKTSEWVHFGETKAVRMSGVVEYVHPEGRFYTVRFETEVGSFTESYYFSGSGRIDHDETDNP